MNELKVFSREEIEGFLEEVIVEAKKINIPVSKNISKTVGVNNRANSRFAACKRVTGQGYMIEVNDKIFGCSKYNIKNILAHEILHTCRGCFNHGSEWKKYSSAMNQSYGYQISRTTTYEQLELTIPQKKKRPKYVIYCEKCGSKTFRQKKSKLVTETNKYRCNCGGKLICTELKQGGRMI